MSKNNFKKFFLILILMVGVFVSFGNLKKAEAAPTGTVNATPCTVPAGFSVCNLSFSWSTSNLISGEPLYLYVYPNEMTNPWDPHVEVLSGSSGNTIYPVDADSQSPYTYYLLHNGVELYRGSLVSASCASGSYWDGNNCFPGSHAIPTGSLSSSIISCNIPNGASSCPINLSWVVNNPLPDANTKITRGGYITEEIISSGINSGSIATNAIGNGVDHNHFYLFHDHVVLGQVDVNTSCASGTSWNGSICTTVMFGTLTPSASACEIQLNQSTCNINFSWTTTNPVGTSAVTKPVNVTVATGNTGTNVPLAVKYNSETFYLYNNAVLLDQETVTSSCISNTSWDGSKCAPLPVVTMSASPTIVSYNNPSTLTWSTTNATSCTASGDWSGSKATSGSQSTGNLTTFKTYTLTCTNAVGNGTRSVTVSIQPMSGTLTPSASSCTIASGASTCNINFSWTTTNPQEISAITKPVNVTVYTGNTGTNVPLAVKYNSETFYLYNNGVLLDQESVSSVCISGTTWDGVKCAPLPPTVSISASPNTISSGSPSTITWSSTRATSCTASAVPASSGWTGAKAIVGGTTSVSPTVTTTYTLSCVGTGGTVTDSVAVTVIGGGKKKPSFEEN